MDIYEISQIISKGDASYLLKDLVDKKQNISEIAKKAGLTRRTIYKYLDNNVKNIKEQTRTQILGVSLLYNREFTMNFIYKKLQFLMADIAYSYLEYLYEKIKNHDKSLEQQKIFQKFETIYQENHSSLVKQYNPEITELYESLKEILR